MPHPEAPPGLGELDLLLGALIQGPLDASGPGTGSEEKPGRDTLRGGRAERLPALLRLLLSHGRADTRKTLPIGRRPTHDTIVAP